MAVLGVASITPAFPKIVKELHVSSEAIGLLITVFTFPGVILTPFLGVFADRWGRKKILIPALFLFGIAGSFCFLVRNFSSLLILRFFQGVGAASLGSLNVTIIGDLYSGKERPAAMGYNASVLSVGTASYPTIGGALAMLGWYYPFILPLIAIPIGFLVLFYLKNPEPRKDEHIREYLINAWQAIRNRRVIGLFIASTFTFILLYGAYLTYLPLLLGSSFKASPLVIGLILSVMSFTTAMTSWQLGRLMAHYSGKALLTVAFLLYGLALAIIPLASNLWVVLIPVLIFGVAHGMNFPTVQTLLTELAPMEYRAAFMSINGMVLRLGQTLGPILMALAFTIGGMNGVFGVGVGFAIATSLVILVTIT